MSVSKRTRFEVLERDGFACHYCGRRAPDVELHVDHQFPRSHGGGDEPANLVSACRDCNLSKHTHEIGPPHYWTLIDDEQEVTSRMLRLLIAQIVSPTFAERIDALYLHIISRQTDDVILATLRGARSFLDEDGESEERVHDRLLSQIKRWIV